MTLAVGDILEGVVIGVKKFGAFIELPNKQTGLVHISEVADDYVKEISDFLHNGDHVSVKILKIESSGKIALSIKQVVAKPPPAPSISFEEMMTKFMKDSSEKQTALRRQQEGRKGNR